jgi:ribosomal-protein-serine acetyltransferase
MITFDQYTIRLLQPADLQQYFNLIDRNRPRLEDFFAGTVALTHTIENTEVYLNDALVMLAERKYYPFVVVDNETGVPIASIQIKSLGWNIPKGELGYYIDASYEGKGIITKAVSRLIDYCFENLKLNKVYIRTYEGNISSRKVAEKNGLTYEGTLRMDYKTTSGKLVDIMYYGLVRKEWEQNR